MSGVVNTYIAEVNNRKRTYQININAVQNRLNELKSQGHSCGFSCNNAQRNLNKAQSKLNEIIPKNRNSHRNFNAVDIALSRAQNRLGNWESQILKNSNATARQLNARTQARQARNMIRNEARALGINNNTARNSAKSAAQMVRNFLMGRNTNNTNV